MINGYPSYPVYKGTYHYDGGYLYDANGLFTGFCGYYMIYWIVSISLFIWFSEADRIYLCVSIMSIWYTMFSRRNQSLYGYPTDRIQCMGKSRNALFGRKDCLWLEDVGSLNLLLYLKVLVITGMLQNIALLRCYVGDEVIYDSTDFPME